jgi:hypothetical protein
VPDDGRDDVCFDTQPSFVLDIAFFSSIIYIWYEGGGLRPLVVKR